MNRFQGSGLEEQVLKSLKVEMHSSCHCLLSQVVKGFVDYLGIFDFEII